MIQSAGFIKLNVEDEERERRYRMWDIYEKQREAYSTAIKGRPTNDLYLTPPPTFDQYMFRQSTSGRDPHVLTQYSESSSSEGSDVKTTLKRATYGPDKGKLAFRKPGRPLWTCCAHELCKTRSPTGKNAGSVSGSLMCPICEGYVHYGCANFEFNEEYKGDPVCILCAQYIKKNEESKKPKIDATK